MQLWARKQILMIYVIYSFQKKFIRHFDSNEKHKEKPRFLELESDHILASRQYELVQFIPDRTCAN